MDKLIEDERKDKYEIELEVVDKKGDDNVNEIDEALEQTEKMLSVKEGEDIVGELLGE